MQAQQQKPNPPYYTPTQTLHIKQSSLFKLQTLNPSHLILSAPDSKCLVTIDKSLTLDSMQRHYYRDRMLALDVVELGVGKFVVAGGRAGGIVVRGVEGEWGEQGEGEGEEGKRLKIRVSEEWEFKNEKPEQNFINEITHHPANPNILVNCYNNGSIAIWGLLTRNRLHTFPKAHEQYTYKLRFQSPSILVSCGHDGSVVRTDLQKHRHISYYEHPLPVWCAYPIDLNQIASVGRFGRVNVWDVRAGRVVQVCNNDAHQSSFVTCRPGHRNQLFFGDLNMLVKWDRRKAKSELASHHTMELSSQAILFDNNRMYVCGRGKDLCMLEGADTLITTTPITHSISLAKGKGEDQGMGCVLLAEHESDYEDADSDDDEDQDDEEEEMEEEREQESDQMDEEDNALLKVKSQESKVRIEAIAKPTIEAAKQYYSAEARWQRQSEPESSPSSQDQVQEKPIKKLKQKKREENSRQMASKQLQKPMPTRKESKQEQKQDNN